MDLENLQDMLNEMKAKYSTKSIDNCVLLLTSVKKLNFKTESISGTCNLIYLFDDNRNLIDQFILE